MDDFQIYLKKQLILVSYIWTRIVPEGRLGQPDKKNNSTVIRYSNNLKTDLQTIFIAVTIALGKTLFPEQTEPSVVLLKQ